MVDSCDRSVRGRATSSASSHTIVADSATSLPRKSMFKERVDSYMSTKNGGGDPVTALSLRPETSSQSTAERQAKVDREMAAALGQLYKQL
ncbi:hypothetical protein PG990_004086 [Apiospora arundinis]